MSELSLKLLLILANEMLQMWKQNVRMREVVSDHHVLHLRMLD